MLQKQGAICQSCYLTLDENFGRCQTSSAEICKVCFIENEVCNACNVEIELQEKYL